jgi:hypothetical protein
MLIRCSLIVVSVWSAGLSPLCLATDDPAMQRTLTTLVDTMMATQLVDPHQPEFGAFVCPSTNPQLHPLHSRAAELVYPLAVLARRTQQSKYADAARRAGDWLVRKQNDDGSWGEDWPNYNGWTGTTADQLLALATAYPLLKAELTAAERQTWLSAITKASGFVAEKMSPANVNYAPTSALGLYFARKLISNAPDTWLKKERSYIERTLGAVDENGLISGEGGGIDGGYNLAQTIGYLALYGRLVGDEKILAVATRALRTHVAFVYPNGSIDDSWGTRSFKWDLESGTKTAPGVYFTFAVLADRDPRFPELLERCFAFLSNDGIRNGQVVYGPDAANHTSATPPCNYGTFARAQSLAIALEYGCEPGKAAASPVPRLPTVSFFRDLKVAVVHTRGVMGTISAYGMIAQYGRTQVTRGGSITNLWMAGYGELGMLQVSSPTYYHRIEPTHMPIESGLRPLTARIELRRGGRYFTNLFEDRGEMQVLEVSDNIQVSVSGELRDLQGNSSGVSFVLTHTFYEDRLEKRVELRGEKSGDAIVLIEPVVKLIPNPLRVAAPDCVSIAGDNGKAAAELRVLACDGTYVMALGDNADRYWAPFPALECAPIEIRLPCGAEGRSAITYSLRVVSAR